MRRLTLPQRILAPILAVQLSLLFAVAALGLQTLRQDMQAEMYAATETARALVLATIGTLQGAVPADQVVPTLSERLVAPRNARITMLDARDGMLHVVAAPSEAALSPPGWFIRAVAPPIQEIRLPVIIEGRRRGFIFISPDPVTQIAISWRDTRRILGLTMLAAALQALLIIWLTRRALHPVATIAARLGDLTQNRLDARVGPLSQPDLAPIAQGVDQLAAALEQARADRARLQRQVVTRADDERKAIARDLHDEMGPCLFGLRVEADALRAHPLARTDAALRDHADAVSTIAGQIGQVNRALLDDLRPIPVGQLPLADMLRGFIKDLGNRFPETEIGIDIDEALPEPDEATALTLFRILQEGTTNALRHAGARSIAVTLGLAGPGLWQIRVRDDGHGFAPGAQRGKGLSGMAERVALLAGRLDIQSDRTGSTLVAELPREATT